MVKQHRFIMAVPGLALSLCSGFAAANGGPDEEDFFEFLAAWSAEDERCLDQSLEMAPAAPGSEAADATDKTYRFVCDTGPDEGRENEH